MNTDVTIVEPTEAVAGLLEARLCRSDSVAIEDAIGEFFTAYNVMGHDRCLDYIFQNGPQDGSRMMGLLKVARNFTGPIVVRNIDDIVIGTSRASAVLDVVIRGEAGKKEIYLVRQDNTWRLDWDSLAGSFMVTAQLRIREGAAS